MCEGQRNLHPNVLSGPAGGGGGGGGDSGGD
jgi:hypothetical protein